MCERCGHCKKAIDKNTAAKQLKENKQPAGRA